MKKILTLTASLAFVLLTGCVTLSIYPFYTAKDVQFDPALLGSWVEFGEPGAERQTWLFEKINDQTYRFTVSDKGEKTEFSAHLFKLKNYTFLDCLVRQHNDYSAPCHTLLRVDRLQPDLEVRPLSYEWLGKLLEKQPGALRHTIISQPTAPNGDEEKTFVLTADTAELQKFILKHIQNKEAWKERLVMKMQ